MFKLELELAEVNGVLTALGQLPYVQVRDLIAKIQVQVQPQVDAQRAQPQEAPKQE